MIGANTGLRVSYGSGSVAVASPSYVTSTTANTSTSSQSFAGISIGTAASNRYVIAAIFESKASGSWSADPISSVTIGGISATLAGTQVTNNANVVALFYANVPTGTTATFAWTLAANTIDTVLGVYRVVDLVSSTPTATASSTAIPPAASLAIPTNGFGIGFAGVNASSSFTWTNMTENFDSVVGSSTASGALNTSSGTSTRTATPGTNDKQVLTLAAWN